MNRHQWIGIGTLAVLVAGGAIASRYPSAAQEKPARGEEASKSAGEELASAKTVGEEFAKAFNAGDAKAVGALWTKAGEYIGPEGNALRGREVIEAAYAEFFKENPKARIEAEGRSVRLLGRHTALDEGTLKLQLPGDPEPGVSRYSALYVREEDGWRVASVREWVPDPQELVSVKDVEWLLGAWTAKGPDAEVRIIYAWDEDKAFLRGRYLLKEGDEVINAGTQIIGKNPGGGLRSWVFDKSGTFGESVWWRDGNRWVIEAAGILPDGSERTAVNVLIPLGKDTFTWQSVERTAAGSPLPDTPPVRVTRAKAGE